MLGNRKKLTGFTFWHNILRNPLYIAAPMVDMSELSFRLLCRRYNCQLCYTPMINSHQYLQDTAYRKSVFTTCDNDRPLIAQFCANDPDVFVAAAKMVEEFCDAIDLNLGCPQGIARKGHYGAYLQDDLELVEKIIKRAAEELSVPVTCKVRILPGPIENTIEYVRMLERAGCSLIAVHGRTRDQKGDQTGLASWEAIRSIKESIGIPVVANGNILNYQDIHNCLEFTKADGIMSAEGLLHNPALFCNKNPLVWEIVEEYLDLAEENQTPIKHIRTHMFRLLQYSLEEITSMRDRLAHANKLEHFREISSEIKKILQDKVLSKDESSRPQMQMKTSLNISDNSNDSSDSINVDWIQTGLFSDHLEEIITDEKDALSLEEEYKNGDTNEISLYNLPVWQCHSRPRLLLKSNENGEIIPDKTNLKTVEDDNLILLRTEQRIERCLHSRLIGKRIRRKAKKIRNKEKQRIKIEDEILTGKHISKRQIIAEAKSRIESAQNQAIKICIDLDFSDLMTLKEQKRLASQLCRLYGSNRQSTKPLHLQFTNFGPDNPFYDICSNNDGFLNFQVDMRPENYLNMIPHGSIIYLTPDSTVPLLNLDPSKAYIIGGLVDDSFQKNVTLRKANLNGIATARLPIVEYLGRATKGTFNQVLSVNQVFDILLEFYKTQDWREALLSGLPSRKGFVLLEEKVQKEKKDDSESCQTASDIC